jgi:hypothetical protein
MQTIDNNVSRMEVVSFNPAINQRKEKVALQMITELADIFNMPSDMEQMSRFCEWRDRALEFATEIAPKNSSAPN